MRPVAIADTETIQTAADWAEGNYKNAVAVSATYPTGGIQFVGTEFACYVYTLDVPAGAGEVTVFTQPMRWSLNEAATSGDGFEVWKQAGAVPGGYEFSAVERSNPIVFSSDEFLPASGNSHASATDPYAAQMEYMVEACQSHVVYLNGQYIENSAGVNIIRPSKWYIRAAYVQWRVNGTAVGPLHDLVPFAIGSSTAPSEGLYPDTGFSADTKWVQPFPSGHSFWTQFGSYLENWNLEFDAGDSIEVDVWYKIGAIKHATNSRKLCISIPRYATDDNQQISNTVNLTPPSGYFIRANQGIVPALLSLAGINMSNGFDPELHTYDFNPSDGTIAMGKAEAAGAIRFSVTSKRLEWAWTETAGSGCGGTSTWRAIAIEGGGLVWVLDEDNCEGGGVPVEPPDPPTVEFETETTSCDCSSAGSGDTWTMSLELIYEFEIAYLKVSYSRPTGTPRSATLYYRPESTGDYVENVNDRWEGTMKCGPTGVFDHMGATTFKIWHGVKQTSGAYPTGLPSIYSALTGILPTEIVVTKVAQ